MQPAETSLYAHPYARSSSDVATAIQARPRLEWTRSMDDLTWWTLGYRVFVRRRGHRARELVGRAHRRPSAAHAGDDAHVQRKIGKRVYYTLSELELAAA